MNPIGKIAYDAYCNARNWKAHNGDDLPTWYDAKPAIQAAWAVAATAVAVHTVNDRINNWTGARHWSVKTLADDMAQRAAASPDKKLIIQTGIALYGISHITETDSVCVIHGNVHTCVHANAQAINEDREKTRTNPKFKTLPAELAAQMNAAGSAKECELLTKPVELGDLDYLIQPPTDTGWIVGFYSNIPHGDALIKATANSLGGEIIPVASSDQRYCDELSEVLKAAKRNGHKVVLKLEKPELLQEKRLDGSTAIGFYCDVLGTVTRWEDEKAVIFVRKSRTLRPCTFYSFDSVSLVPCRWT